MDDALTFARADTVQYCIARQWLDLRRVTGELGSVTLAPHQQDAAARLLQIMEEYGGALLADAVGTGKTFAALAVARAFRSCVVVAPASLRAMWSGAVTRAGLRAPVVSFESLSRGGPLLAHRGELVVVDEAHHTRNPRTRRYDALSRLASGARVLLLSATPLHNRPRELRSLFALFLGARADSLTNEAMARLVVRRGADVLSGATRLPALEPTKWLTVTGDRRVLGAITDVPPPVPAADGGVAAALARLGLLRAWTSSDAALRATLRQRLLRGVALSHALNAGRFPTRREVASWTAVDDAVQLAFPELVTTAEPTDAGTLRVAIEKHSAGLRRVAAALDASADADDERATHLRWLRRAHAGARIVVFTQFAQTARAMFDRMRRDGAVALVTSHGARIASGPIARREIVDRFGVGARSNRRHLPLDLLICTDVLSEGLDLQDASVLVHLDLPWTAARITQRVGRLKRMGSRHDHMHVYAIGPPPHARQLMTVVRSLLRKSRMARAFSDDDEPALEGLLDARRRTPHGRGRAGSLRLGESLRVLLASWLGEGPDPAVPSTEGEPGRLCAIVHGATGATSWRAIALCRVRGRPRLLAVASEGVSEHPGAVIGIARSVPRGMDGLRRLHAGESSALRAVAAACRQTDRWLAEQRGAALASPALDAPSRAHVRVLRRIDELYAGAPRHLRAEMSGLAWRCRTLVPAATGAGAERRLAEWIAADQRASPVRAASDRLEALATSLHGWGIASPAPVTLDTSLVALLVLLGA